MLMISVDYLNFLRNLLLLRNSGLFVTLPFLLVNRDLNFFELVLYLFIR